MKLKNTSLRQSLLLFLISFCCVTGFYACSSRDAVSPNIANENGTGKSGSLARFTIYNDYLYVADATSLKVFKISDQKNPVYHSKVNLGMNIETLFPYGDKLFIGSASKIYIFDLSNPESPVQLSATQHLDVGCDPVVVQNDIAYSTLRLGMSCGRYVEASRMEIYDVSDLRNPNLVNTLRINNPYGLGIDGELLFVCQADSGLGVYSISDPIRPTLIASYPQFNAYDVIPISGENRLLMTGKDGFYQLDYSDPLSVKVLSKISTNK